MADFSTTTSDQLLDRLAELEREIQVEPEPGSLTSDAAKRLFAALQEVGLIHIELARRTATGWRPL